MSRTSKNSSVSWDSLADADAGRPPLEQRELAWQAREGGQGKSSPDRFSDRSLEAPQRFHGLGCAGNQPSQESGKVRKDEEIPFAHPDGLQLRLPLIQNEPAQVVQRGEIEQAGNAEIRVHREKVDSCRLAGNELLDVSGRMVSVVQLHDQDSTDIPGFAFNNRGEHAFAACLDTDPGKTIGKLENLDRDEILIDQVIHF